MRLYHGSNVRIESIDLSKSKPGKDFGRGFYLSPNEIQAKEMAVGKCGFLGGEPVVTIFEFDESALSDTSLRILRFDGYSSEWADFVLANRIRPADEPVVNYDIVIGPIANDRIGAQIRRLLEGDIEKDVFLKRIQYMHGVTMQYFFGTARATRFLRRINE